MRVAVEFVHDLDPVLHAAERDGAFAQTETMYVALTDGFTTWGNDYYLTIRSARPDDELATGVAYKWRDQALVLPQWSSSVIEAAIQGLAEAATQALGEAARNRDWIAVAAYFDQFMVPAQYPEE